MTNPPHPVAEFVAEVVATWRTDAAVAEAEGRPDQTETYEHFADALHRRAAAWLRKKITVDEAAKASGHSVEGIRWLMEVGAVSNVGRRRAPRIRRGDLPRKVGPFPRQPK